LLCQDGQIGRLFLRRMTPDELQTLIEEATADYALGESDAALAKLNRATTVAPDAFEAWHALAEVNFSLRRLDGALAAAERAHALRPDDLFLNTTLSRIWMERGDKARAEHFGAQAKIQSWKDQLKNPAPPPTSP
jgi:Flp pilus assembly protein TadD